MKVCTYTKLMPGPWDPENRWHQFNAPNREKAIEFLESFPLANRIAILCKTKPKTSDANVSQS
jgi:hypothetical protein